MKESTSDMIRAALEGDDTLTAEERSAVMAVCRNPATDERVRWESLTGSMNMIIKSLADMDPGRFQKPLLTISEAAAMLSISTKRFENLICEERKRLGRSPDFIVDAGGRIQRRVLRDELISWAKRRGKGDRRRRTALET